MKESYKIGQEITIVQDFEMVTVGGRVLQVKEGDRAIIKNNNKAVYITGEAKDVMQIINDVEIKGYDYINIASLILNRLNGVFGLEEFLENEDIEVEDFTQEIADVLIDIL